MDIRLPLRTKARSGSANPSASDAGFSLTELLVVLLIMSLLVGIAAPRVMGYLGGAKEKTAAAQIQNLATALEMFALDAGRYPTPDEGLQVLVARPAQMPSWNGPYIREASIPLDPWGNDYVYDIPGQDGRDFALFSKGVDGEIGGEDDGKDITF